jgi:hypothetical protein
MNSTRKIQRKHSTIKLAPRDELERKKEKTPAMKVLKVLEADQVTCSCM